MSEKCKQEPCCETGDALECALKCMENRRKHIRDVMKPAEKAAKDLENKTATEKVRLQGTKEPNPVVKPYTEAVDVKHRKELGKLIESAKQENRPWKVKRCTEEKTSKGYRYTFYTQKLLEYLEPEQPEQIVTEFTLDRNEKVPEDIRPTVENVIITENCLVPYRQPNGQREDIPGIPHKAFEGCTNLKTVKLPNCEHCVIGYHPFDGLNTRNIKIIANTSTRLSCYNDDVATLRPMLERTVAEDIELTDVSDEVPADVAAEEPMAPAEIDLGIEMEQPAPEEAPVEEPALTAMDVLKSKLDVKVEDGKVTITLKGSDEEDEDAVKLELDANEDEAAALCAEFGCGEEEPEFDEEDTVELDFSKLGEEEPEEDKDEKKDEEEKVEEALEEASSAEKNAFKNGGEDYADYVDGKAIARIKDPDERARAIADKRLAKKNKLGNRPAVDKEYERKVDQASQAFQKKQQKMADAGLTEDIKIDLDDLSLFNPWGGAKDTWELVVKNDKLEELNNALEDMYPDGIKASELNDILWFEKDWVFDTLGINPLIADEEDIIDAEAEVIEPAGDEE